MPCAAVLTKEAAVAAASAAISAVMLGHGIAGEGKARPLCLNHDMRWAEQRVDANGRLEDGRTREPALGSAEHRFSGRSDKLVWR